MSPLSNNRVNATVRPVTPLACASVAPGRPARYAVRWTDKAGGAMSNCALAFEFEMQMRRAFPATRCALQF
jgi:hypothetical protein